MIVNSSDDKFDDFEVIFKNSFENERAINIVDGKNQQKQSGPTKISLNSVFISDKNEKIREPVNTCKILQRKLELKVERAKRNYLQFHQKQNQKSHQLKQQDKYDYRTYDQDRVSIYK